jgi:hypothetical protein
MMLRSAGENVAQFQDEGTEDERDGNPRKTRYALLDVVSIH